MMDAQDVNKAARIEQEQRVTAQQDALPNESTCVAAASPAALTQTALTATALTQGLKTDLARRSQNAVEKLTGTPPSLTPPGMTPASDTHARWIEYCKEFYDPQGNNGKSACPSATPGIVVNGDVSIEGFLLKDTIDMNNPDQYTAASALLRNLVQPDIGERLDDKVIATTAGQEHIIRKQHLDAINNVAADVIGSMISRRTAMPITPLSSNVGQYILEIRERAGIPDCSTDTLTNITGMSPTPAQPGAPLCASDVPSYDEIMQAMTKERFFDPEYFFRLQNNPGSLKQEQASIDAYTTIEMQDIYRMQEQINALLAARAALKLSTDTNGSQTPSSPNK